MVSPRSTGGKRPPALGFALVVTMTMMGMVVVLALALLALAAGAMRGTTAVKAREEARGNARLAVALALGQLQTHLGPDQRVSAPAGAVAADAAQPHVVGAWESWRWMPNAGGTPDFGDKAGRFKRWLVSTHNPAGSGDATLPMHAPGADSVLLVNPATTGKPKRYQDAALDPAPEVRVERLPVEYSDRHARVAWASFDQSLKAPIQLEAPKTTDIPTEVAGRFAAPRARPDLLSATLAPLATARNLVNLETAGLAVEAGQSGEIARRFHDLTTESMGLLADVGEGGLKTDLTSVFESSATAASILRNETPYLTKSLGAPTWEYIKDHYRLYKRVVDGKAGAPRVSLGVQTDLKPTPLSAQNPGLDPNPAKERLLPVIAKLQILFSIVSHHAHIADRVEFLNTYGDPKGNQNHAVPHVVYDTIVTLYNPYDVAIDLRNLRVRIWDPPVGFRLKKNNVFYRPEMASGQFHPLARFQIAYEKNPSARKYFTLFLTGRGKTNRPGDPIQLLPGEVKVFSPWVEDNWTWAMEAGSGYNPRAFFDWNAGNDFGNRDNRTGNTKGLETIPGWDARAGLQTDHMSYAARPAETLYPFEATANAAGHVGGYLSMRLGIGEQVTIQAKPLRAIATGSNDPDFMVDVLSGTVEDVTQDLLRRYSFRFDNVEREVSETPANPVIERVFKVEDTMQYPSDKTPGKKSPFAVLTMSARTTVDPLDDTKAWLYNNPVVEGALLDSKKIGVCNNSYDVRLQEVADFTTFPGVEIDADTQRGYFGASATANRGVSNVPMFRVPPLPASSLGELVPANLVASGNLPRVTHPLGNSWAHPLLGTRAVATSSAGTSMLDHCFLMNNALWDSYFFSSVTDYEGGLFASANRKRKTVLQDFLSGTQPLLNARFHPYLGTGGTPENLAQTLNALGDADRSRQLAAHMVVDGAFNLNSTSVDAWRAFLTSLRDREIQGWRGSQHPNSKRTPFARMGLPLAGAAETSSEAGFDLRGQIRWAGFRSLDDNTISTLAQAIVRQIQKRGTLDKAPCLSLGEFVNRRPGNAGGLHALAGLLQTAINESDVNKDYHRQDSKSLKAGGIPDYRRRGTVDDEILDGYSGEGTPPMLTQGDLMAALAPVATVRGDTFKIRACGETTTASGAVIARAWCEAVVQRLPDYIKTTDTPDTRPDALKEGVNRRFGRKFIILGFRWLSPEEV